MWVVLVAVALLGGWGVWPADKKEEGEVNGEVEEDEGVVQSLQ